MIAELLGECVVGAVRIVVGALAEIGGELLIRGPGYLVCRLFSRNVDFESGTVVISGLLFWVVIGTVAYAITRHIHHPVSCIGASAGAACSS